MDGLKNKISEAGRKRRGEIVEYARASVELEGGELTDKTKELCNRFIFGELTMKEFVELNLGE